MHKDQHSTIQMDELEDDTIAADIALKLPVNSERGLVITGNYW